MLGYLGQLTGKRNFQLKINSNKIKQIKIEKKGHKQQQ